MKHLLPFRKERSRNLLKPENKDQLIAVLTYHVVPGKIMSSDIAGTATMVESVQGSELDVNATDGVTVDGATVVTADIETDNGVIHVIDRVVYHSNIYLNILGGDNLAA